jgi:hypothetical protein
MTNERRGELTRAMDGFADDEPVLFLQGWSPAELTCGELRSLLASAPSAPQPTEMPSDFDALAEHHRVTEAENASMRAQLAKVAELRRAMDDPALSNRSRAYMALDVLGSLSPSAPVERPQPSLETAIEIATGAHRGQLDKQGEPYILHLLRVMEALRGFDVEYLIVGVLHDVIEDTTWTLEGLRGAGFSEAVVSAVDAVTRRKSAGETYREFICRAAKNQIGRAVKIADVRDHLSRITPELEALRPKYANALVMLGGAPAETQEERADALTFSVADLPIDPERPEAGIESHDVYLRMGDVSLLVNVQGGAGFAWALSSRDGKVDQHGSKNTDADGAYAAQPPPETPAQPWHAPKFPPMKVGCERTDGTLNIHLESETCEVCQPEAPSQGKEGR